MTNTEIKELLELAAKACGLEIDKSETNGGGRGNTGFDVRNYAVLDWYHYKCWSPLDDDGDYSRMEAQLEIYAIWHEDHVTALQDENTISFTEWYADHNNDKQAARRAAGTRLAAESRPTRTPC